MGSSDDGRFVGHSDTETLVNGFDKWGVVDTIRRLVGMFAIAVWDRREQRLWLVRDRMGEKPLYYSKQNNVLAFASEATAFEAVPNRTLSLSQAAIAERR